MIINPNFIVGGPKLYSCVFNGAPSEKLTLKDPDGIVLSIYPTTKSNGVSDAYDIPEGIWIITGERSGYTRTIEINQAGTYNARPDYAYYWYGIAPYGEWAAAAALPSYFEYQDDKEAPTLTPSTYSVYAKSLSGTYAYNRGGSIYLPKTTVKGSSLKIDVTNAFSHGNGGSAGAYLVFGLASNISGAYTAAKYANIGSGYNELTGTYSLDMSSVSGGSYSPFVALTTSSSGTGTKPSYLTVNALWSE